MRHHVGGVLVAQSTDGAYRQFPYLKHLVIQRNEQRAQILRLRQMRVILVVQRK